MTIIPGQVISNRFRIESHLGSGGMGNVFKVWDFQRNAPLALKALHKHLAETPDGLRQLKAEAQALERLTHPNIVPFYGFFGVDDDVFLLEEFIEGTSLKEILKKKKAHSFSSEEVLNYLKPICTGLHYAHNQGIIHCDVKPGNILCNNRGQVYLTDFGIAHYLGTSRKSDKPIGTPAYMAPEQIRGETPTRQTDVYALGILLYSMLTGGQLPFTGDRAEVSGTFAKKVMWEQTHLSPPTPRLINPSISPGVEAVIFQCLEKDANLRYSTVLDFFNDLAIALTNTTRHSHQAEHQTNGIQISKVRIKQLLLVGVIALTLIVIIPFALTRDKINDNSLLIQPSTPPIPKRFTPVPSATLPPILRSDYPVMACMSVQLDANNKVEECVTNIHLLDDRKMRISFSWSAKLTSGASVEISSSFGNENMYLVDNLGNRYNALQVGDGAAQNSILQNGDILSGWFLFPAAPDEARYFIFHDDDNSVSSPIIDRMWP